MMTKLPLLLLLLPCLALSKVNYEGYQVLRTAVPTELQLTSLQSLTKDFSFWSQPSLGQGAEILVAPDRVDDLENQLGNMQLDFQIKVKNVQRLIEGSEAKMEKRESNSDYELTWDQYYKSEVIVDYLKYLANNYEGVSTRDIGKTFEERSIVALEVLRAGEGKTNIFIEGTAHGREWISPAVVTYLIRELVERSELHKVYLDNFNFYFVPVYNPDGYNYAHDVDRLWRKTRTLDYSTECPGADPNRNYDFKFGVGGSSTDPCDDFYQGPESLSEAESSAIASYFRSLTPVPELALSYHSARGVFWYPFYYSDVEVQPNIDEVLEMCNDAVEALNAVDNQEHECLHGGAASVRGGTSLDWYVSEGSRFSFKPTLRDNGYGFLLPPEFIEPSGKENWEALKVMLDKLLQEQQ